jgi:hypothetical protein
MICPKQEETNDDIELHRTDTPANRRVIRWHSCCLTCDKDFVEYMVKYFLLCGLMIFFSVELHISEKCESDQLYTGLLTLIIGIALPSPRLK